MVDCWAIDYWFNPFINCLGGGSEDMDAKALSILI